MLLAACSPSNPPLADSQIEPPGPVKAECSGLDVKPGDDIQELLQEGDPGKSFCFSGHYRVTETLHPRRGQRLIGTSGATLNGSELVTNWRPREGLWVSEGHEDGPTVNYQGNFPGFLNPQARFSDDVFLDDRRLEPVTAIDELKPGGVFFDYDDGAIWLAGNPAAHTLELAITKDVIESRAPDVTVKNFVIEKSLGMGIDAGEDWTVKDSEIRLNATVGLKLASGGRALDNSLHHNGQYGMTGAGDDLRVAGNEIAFNNSHGYYSPDGGNWASGGTKFVHTGDSSDPGSGAILRRNWVHDNYGDGLWADISNIHMLMENNTIERNERHGIKYEISYDAIIRGNTLRNNSGAAVFINSSPNVEVHDNVLSGNGAQIELVQQDRGTGLYGPLVLEGGQVHDNVVKEG